jgi:hypothetical protein
MRRFTTVLVASVVACCLTFVSSNAAAKITHKNVKCDSKNTKQMGDGIGCEVTLNVRPPGGGGGGGGGSPADWGMCGVQSVSAAFGPATEARIVVDKSGYYAVRLVGYNAGTIPSLDLTCVLFTDFSGVPPAVQASYFEAPTFKSIGGTEKVKKSTGNACVWAGLSGNLEGVTNYGTGLNGGSYAQFSAPETVLFSQGGTTPVTTYAFCSGYTAASWKGWKYVVTKPGLAAASPGGVPTGHDEGQDWCYTDEILAQKVLQKNIEIIPPIKAGLTVSKGKYSAYAKPAGVGMGYNCLPLKQQQ